MVTMNSAAQRAGPLKGLRVVEFAAIGPAPHCTMLLADLGAEVLRIDREGGNGVPNPVLDRGRPSIVLDIHLPEHQARALDILDHADVLIEGFRPGVMERRGLGPEIVMSRNPRIIYGRMTGWGQTGKLSQSAGHDINYIALTGALAAMGAPGSPPPPPLNLVGDFGGGSLYLAVGILSALWERNRSGQGQVVDAAIVDGVASMLSIFAGLIPQGAISLDREQSMLSGAAPFYRCYLCSDGRYVAVGPVEPKFYVQLLDKIGAPAELLARQYKTDAWTADSQMLASLFITKSRDQWCDLLENTDVCFAPVLTFDESAQHRHATDRGTYKLIDGAMHSVPAPRFSRTPGAFCDGRLPVTADEILERWRKPDSVRKAGGVP